MKLKGKRTIVYFILSSFYGILAVKDTKEVTVPFDLKQSNIKPLPDLNFPPPIEEDQVDNTPPKEARIRLSSRKKDSYKERVEKKLKAGILDEWKATKYKDQQRYWAKMTPEQKLKKKNEYQNKQIKRIKAVNKHLIFLSFITTEFLIDFLNLIFIISLQLYEKEDEKRVVKLWNVIEHG